MMSNAMARFPVMGSNSSDQCSWTVLIPVKQTTLAKSRLATTAPSVRQQLARAFALDTAAAALGCPHVRRVVVVTNDPQTSELESLGAHVLDDQPDAGLNSALTYAAQQVRRSEPAVKLAALSADLPALRPEDLSLAFDAARGAAGWFVADTQGVGTTMLATTTVTTWLPSFGPTSRATHRAIGYREIAVPGLARLRRDVDTEIDLRDAELLGVGRHTQAVLAALA